MRTYNSYPPYLTNSKFPIDHLYLLVSPTYLQSRNLSRNRSLTLPHGLVFHPRPPHLPIIHLPASIRCLFPSPLHQRIPHLPSSPLIRISLVPAHTTTHTFPSIHQPIHRLSSPKPTTRTHPKQTSLWTSRTSRARRSVAAGGGDSYFAHCWLGRCWVGTQR